LLKEAIVYFEQKTATRWSNANVNINLDDLGQLSKTTKTAAPTMKELQKQSSTPLKGFLAPETSLLSSNCALSKTGLENLVLTVKFQLICIFFTIISRMNS